MSGNDTKLSTIHGRVYELRNTFGVGLMRVVTPWEAQSVVWFMSVAFGLGGYPDLL